VKNDASGFIGGGQIGYNLQAGNVVFGIEATLSRTNLSDDYRSVVNPFVTYSTDINWTGSVVGRLGFLTTAFLSAGQDGRRQTYSCLATIPWSDGFSGDDQRHGWVVGGGVEYAFNRPELGRQYNYMDLGTVSNGIHRCWLHRRHQNVDLMCTRSGSLNFKFGGDHARR
jgi:outer membrane immunogenic protein